MFFFVYPRNLSSIFYQKCVSKNCYIVDITGVFLGFVVFDVFGVVFLFVVDLRNIPLMYSQNQVKSWDIVDIEFLWVVGDSGHFMSNASFVLLC